VQSLSAKQITAIEVKHSEYTPLNRPLLMVHYTRFRNQYPRAAYQRYHWYCYKASHVL